MSPHDERCRRVIDQYNDRRAQEEEDDPDRFTADLSARAFYEEGRFSHIHYSERTVETRRRELQVLFDRVDEEELQKGQTQMKVLGEVTNILTAVTARKQPETVMRTEIVPILPCKGYELPQKTLFIGGRSDYVKVSRPVEDHLLDELWEDTCPTEEQILFDYLANQESGGQENEQAEKGTSSRVQTTRKAKKNGKESEEAGASSALPNCTVG